MEAAMHGSFDRPGEAVKTIYRNWGVGIFVLPILLVAFFVGLVMMQPNVSTWIAEAARAEFNPGSEIAPSVFAQPPTEVRTVKAN
jgi:hypothetical protein